MPESLNHFGSVYDTLDERVRVVCRFLKDGLDRNERCICIVDDPEAPAIASTLAEAGTSSDSSDRRTLLLKTGEFLDNGKFRRDRLIDRFHSELKDSLTAGFTGLRLVTEMTWIFRVDAPEQCLLECEAAVDGFTHTQPTTHLCMFPREKFQDLLLSGVIRTHPVLIFGGETYDLNPFYEPGEEILSSDGSRHVEWAFSQLAHLHRLKKQIDTVHETGTHHELFLHRLSHELKTPMTTILGWCNLMHARKLSQENLTQAIDAIKRNVDLQNRLIEELMDACRLASGKLTLNLRPIRLTHLLLEFVESFWPVFKSKDIALTCSLDVSIGTVPADEIRLQQIVGNLLTNAVKFTPAGGRVVVELGSQNSEVVIAVHDTGVGISTDLLPHVFNRFAQTESGRSLGGLGLGLSIVHDLVKLHGGTVGIESAGEGCGTTVRISLPIDRSAESGRSTESAA